MLTFHWHCICCSVDICWLVHSYEKGKVRSNLEEFVFLSCAGISLFRGLKKFYWSSGSVVDQAVYLSCFLPLLCIWFWVSCTAGDAGWNCISTIWKPVKRSYWVTYPAMALQCKRADFFWCRNSSFSIYTSLYLTVACKVWLAAGWMWSLFPTLCRQVCEILHLELLIFLRWE